MVAFRSDRQPRLFFMSLGAAVVSGAALWAATGLAIAGVGAALAAFCAVTFGVGGFRRDDSAQRLRELKRRDRMRGRLWS
jgi:membrane protein implicated in regulation of membrane protease activity